MQPIELGRIYRHCEERSDEAIQSCRIHAMDCFASLAMTVSIPSFCWLHFKSCSEERPMGKYTQPVWTWLRAASRRMRAELSPRPPPKCHPPLRPTKQSGNTKVPRAIERTAKSIRQTGRDATTASRQHWRTTMF